MFNFIKNIKMITCRKNEVNESNTMSEECTQVDYVQKEERPIKYVDAPVIINPESSRTLLIVNSTQGVMELLNLNFKNILQTSQIDIQAEYKMVICNGPDSGLMAINYIKEHHVDVALIDLVLANMDTENLDEFTGLALAEMIRRKNTYSKIGILSSFDILKVQTSKLGNNLRKSLNSIDVCLTFSQLGSGREVLKLLA